MTLSDFELKKNQRHRVSRNLFATAGLLIINCHFASASSIIYWLMRAVSAIAELLVIIGPLFDCREQ